jgi:two-component system, response regulator PdtaR
MVVLRSRPFSALIADDDPDFREALRMVLEPFLNTIEARSGEEAIDILHQSSVDIVLVDMHMHVLTGLDTVRIVKQLYAIIPCILITADATDELRRDAQSAAACAVLKKPVTRRELVSTVSSALLSAYSDAEPLLGA